MGAPALRESEPCGSIGGSSSSTEAAQTYPSLLALPYSLIPGTFKLSKKKGDVWDTIINIKTSFKYILILLFKFKLLNCSTCLNEI